MLIDCGSCAMRDIACGDCVVSHFLATPPQGHLGDPERQALSVLQGAGLVPPLRMTEAAPARTLRGTGS